MPSETRKLAGMLHRRLADGDPLDWSDRLEMAGWAWRIITIEEGAGTSWLQRKRHVPSED